MLQWHYELIHWYCLLKFRFMKSVSWSNGNNDKNDSSFLFDDSYVGRIMQQDWIEYLILPVMAQNWSICSCVTLTRAWFFEDSILPVELPFFSVPFRDLLFRLDFEVEPREESSEKSMMNSTVRKLRSSFPSSNCIQFAQQKWSVHWHLVAEN